MRATHRRAWTRPLPLLGALLALTVTPSRAAVVCTGAALCGSGTGPCTIGGSHTVPEGCHLDFGSRSITLTGTLEAQSTGGSFSVSAGALTLDNGKLRSPGTASTNGGDIAVQVAGTFRMQGGFARIDTAATSGGGAITVSAASIELAGGKILSNGGGTASCGDGGDVSLTATGSLLIAAPIDATASADCGGGNVSITGTSIVVSQSINVSGGDAGLAAVELSATNGSISTLGAGAIRANGAPVAPDTGGSGGTVVLAATGNLSIGAAIEATGAIVDGSGGAIELTAGGDVAVSELLNVDGIGASSFGGSISIEAGGAVSLTRDLRARGGPAFIGGSIEITAGGNFTQATTSTMLADGGLAGFGFIDVLSRKDAVFLGVLRARGSGGGGGGSISIETCSADLRSTVDVTAPGSAPPGSISVRGGTVAVRATAALLATGCPNGSVCNTIDVRVGVPLIEPTAVLNPPAVIGLDPGIDVCCGNSRIELGETCDDSNSLSCDGCSRSCTLEASPPCPSDNNECTRDCSPAQGCVYAPLSGTRCAGDGNACTNDVCSNGTCTHPPLSCNDKIFCTIDSCNPATGCRNEPDDARCADGSTCTTESCEPGRGCVYVAEPDGAPCTDNNLCTTGDTCRSGACVPARNRDCNDSNPCTTDACSGFVGCLHTDDPAACPCAVAGLPQPAGTACADGNSCTRGETCDGGGHCTGGALACDDGDPCTTDACFQQLFCTHVDDACGSCSAQSEGSPCGDGNSCTRGTCEGGTCISEPHACDDDDPCNGSALCMGTLGCRMIDYSDPSCATPSTPFVCYRSVTSRGTPAFSSIADVAVRDARGSWTVGLRRIREICLPADVDGLDPAAPESRDGLETYLARDERDVAPALPLRGVRVTTVYGAMTLDLSGADRLRVPTAFDLARPPGAPIPPDPDALRCYRARLARAATSPRGLSIRDAFGSLTVDLWNPTRLCFPADVAGQHPAAPEHPDHLLCFQVRTSKGHPPFLRRTGIHVENLFGAGRRDALRPSELCLPATLTP